MNTELKKAYEIVKKKSTSFRIFSKLSRAEVVSEVCCMRK